MIRADTIRAGTLRAGALAAALAGSVLATTAGAAPAPGSREPAAAVVPVQLRQTAAADEPADCSRPRKRLWIAGEGWVVRKVTICR